MPEAHTFRLRIAGLDLDVRSCLGVRGVAGAEFAPFVVDPGGAQPELEVSYEPADGRPWFALGARRFGAGTTWDLHDAADGEGQVLRWAPGRPEGALRNEARVSGDWTRCEIRYEPFPPGEVPLEVVRSELEVAFQTRLARSGGALVHACGLVLEGKALLLPGSSGRGKSTLAGQLPAEVALSDERPALRVREGDAAWLHGTPWRGTAGRVSAGAAPLGAVAFLGLHEPPWGLRPLPPGEAFRRLCFHAFPPLWDREGMERVLELAQRVVTSVPCFELRYRLGDPVEPLLLQAVA
jgi:hypothetical protein